MAELTAGAVNTLLGVLRNELQLLRQLGGDVHFIKEEMESMNSFLSHLARTTPPGGTHDEQVSAWMKQVRDLAQDCSSCIDLYLRRGDPEIHRARGPVMRFAWWLPWIVGKVVAQHHVANKLSVLKERARDVGERRMRYGVKVPGKLAAPGDQAPKSTTWTTTMAVPAAALGQGEEEDEETDDDNYYHSRRRRRRHQAALMAPDGSYGDHRRRVLEPRTLEEYCADMLVDWLNLQQWETTAEGRIPCIAVVASGTNKTGDIARNVLSQRSANYFDHTVIWINLRALHFWWNLPLLSAETLCYILRECEPPQCKLKKWEIKYQAYRFKEDLYGEIIEKISRINLDDKIKMIGSKIEEFKSKIIKEEEEAKKNNTEEGKRKITKEKEGEEEANKIKKTEDGKNNVIKKEEETKKSNKIEDVKSKINLIEQGKSNKITQSFDVLLRALTLNQENVGGATSSSPDEAAQMLKDHFEEDHKPEICLDTIQYKDILQKVFPDCSNEAVQAQQEATVSTGMGTAPVLGEDQIKEIIRKIAPGIIQEEGSSSSRTSSSVDKQPAAPTMKPSDAFEAAIKEAKEKLWEISEGIKEQMVIKGIVDKIKNHLKGKKTLIILQDDEDYISFPLEEIRKALSLIGCGPGSAVVVTTKNSQRANDFCYPEREPMTCSLVGVYYDRALRLTGVQFREVEDKAKHSHIIHDILDKCDPDEFCMRVFTHALYGNPNRSYEELVELQGCLLNLQQYPLGNNTATMFKFSYNGLREQHKSCLLYLAIYPQGYKIRRSALVGRCVVEGLITMEEWPSAVRRAERCFDTLIDQLLVYPGDVGAAGEVKSCFVGELVHDIITKIAKKQRIVDTRLSHHLARHFSIFNDLRLRRSDKIEKFVKKLHKYALQLTLLKVLDLEGCHCFDKSPSCLKDMCNNMLLLKYLSLRRTDVIHLPPEINNLHELEILDIRQTDVPAPDTREVVLLKLKRLMAGCVRPSSPFAPAIGDVGVPSFSSVRIPYKIKKMENMEILSNVKASQAGSELKDIGKLWQLRKLGVVIRNQASHLRYLLRAISDLNECLESLSITLLGTISEGTQLCEDLPDDIRASLKQPPKYLKSLSITGTKLTFNRTSLPFVLLANGWGKLNKLTFSGTSLKQDSSKVIGQLPKLFCFRLRHEAYTDEELTFKEKEFLSLKYLIIEGTNMTSIRFEQGSAPMLEKIVVFFTSIEYFHGVTHLQNFKVLELNGNEWLQLACLVGASRLSKVTLKNTLLDLSEHKTLAEVPTLHTLMLLQKSCIGSNLNFNKGEFKKLNLLVIDCSDITSVSFTNKAAPMLNKIVWSFTTKIESLSGIDNLPELKEIELNIDLVPDQVIQDIKAHKNKPLLTHMKPQDQPQEKGRAEQQEKRSPYPWFSKISKHRR